MASTTNLWVRMWGSPVFWRSCLYYPSQKGTLRQQGGARTSTATILAYDRCNERIFTVLTRCQPFNWMGMLGSMEGTPHVFRLGRVAAHCHRALVEGCMIVHLGGPWVRLTIWQIFTSPALFASDATLEISSHMPQADLESGKLCEKISTCCGCVADVKKFRMRRMRRIPCVAWNLHGETDGHICHASDLQSELGPTGPAAALMDKSECWWFEMNCENAEGVKQRVATWRIILAFMNFQPGNQRSRGSPWLQNFQIRVGLSGRKSSHARCWIILRHTYQ